MLLAAQQQHTRPLAQTFSDSAFPLATHVPGRDGHQRGPPLIARIRVSCTA